MFKNPFDARNSFNRGCGCGQHSSQSEHDAAMRAEAVETAANTDKTYENVVANAVLRQLFPVDAHRRAFLQKLGASTAAAAVLPMPGCRHSNLRHCCCPFCCCCCCTCCPCRPACRRGCHLVQHDAVRWQL